MLLPKTVFHLKGYIPIVFWSFHDTWIIRIYHECKGRIEKSVLRIALMHHEDCRVMTNGDLEGQIFLAYPHTNNGFLHTTVLIKKTSFQKSLNTLRYNFT